MNVIGFTSARLGLGVAARATIAALVRSDIPTAVVDVTLPDGRSGFDQTWNHLFITDVAPPLPHPVTIVHVNPVEASMLLQQFSHWFTDRFNVIVPFFELPAMPSAWAAPLASFDMILAASTHIGAAANAICSTPIRNYPMGIDVQPAQHTREHFGLPPDRFIFATTFDTDSGLQRKNGLGMIAAFELAFPQPDSDAMLVIKLNGIRPPSPPMRAAFDRLVRAGKAVVLEQYLPYADVLSLYQNCDAFVSLHRAEGLGLGLMEAMSMGKPVVATGWSGNMDFMDDTNSALVRYVFTPVLDTQPEYARERFATTMHWAEPDPVQAVRVMRRIHADAAYRQKIGAKAQRDIARRNEHFFGGECVAALEAAYEAFEAAK